MQAMEVNIVPPVTRPVHYLHNEETSKTQLQLHNSTQLIPQAQVTKSPIVPKCCSGNGSNQCRAGQKFISFHLETTYASHMKNLVKTRRSHLSGSKQLLFVWRTTVIRSSDEWQRNCIRSLWVCLDLPKKMLGKR